MSNLSIIKSLIQLGKKTLENEYPGKTFEELKSILKEPSHRELSNDWTENILTTNVFNKDIKVYTLKSDYLVLASGKSMTIKKIHEMYENKELYFTFTYSKKFNMIFFNFNIKSNDKTNYVIEITKNTGEIECYSYYKDTYEEQENPALYQIIGRMFTNEIAGTWTGGKFKTQEQFEKDNITEEKFSKETIVRCN